MALPDITFTRNQSGLGRQLPGEDHISGMMFYMANGDLPSGFLTSDRNKVIYSVQDAEDLGVLDDFSDEIACTDGAVQITGVGATGDTWTITIPDYLGGTTTLATYVEQSGDGVNDVSAGLNTNLNNNTTSHGYTSTVLTDTVTIVQPVGYGIYPSTVTLASASSGAGTTAVTQFIISTAEGSFLAIMHYLISEFFRIQPKGILYLGIESNAATWDGDGIVELQNYAEGKIRQMGIFITEIDGSINAGKTFATSLLDTIQAKIAVCQTAHKPFNAFVVADVKGDALSGLTDLSALSGHNITLCSGQDRGNYGYLLSLIYGYSVSDMGTMLGVVSLARVHQCIANVGRFDITGTVTKTNGNNFTLADGTEHDEAGFATGAKTRDQVNSLLEALQAKSQVFQKKHVGTTGTYWNDSWTCIAQDNDLCYIETNRVIDKGVRNGRTKLLPYLAGDIYLNDDGTMTSNSVSLFENVVGSALRQMTQDGELSAYSVDIDDTQNVGSTDTVAVTMNLIKVAIGRTFDINIGFIISL